MKGYSFLLATVFLLAFVLLLSSSVMPVVYAAPVQNPIQSNGDPQEEVTGFPQLFAGKGGAFVVIALIWLLMSGIIAIRDCIITKQEHGSGASTLNIKKKGITGTEKE
jgi:hypothetical protein